MPTKMNNEICYGLVTDTTVRKLDAKVGTVQFVAATEKGVDTWRGRIYLLMSGVDLTQFNANPVLLDAHDRSSADRVIGKASVFKRKTKLYANVEFASDCTDRAKDIKALVMGGFVNAVSVGFTVSKSRILRVGEVYALKDRKIKGPAEVVLAWTLLEISVVPVSANPEAVRLAFMHSIGPLIGDTAHSARDIHKPHPTQEDTPMSDKEPRAEDEQLTAQAPPPEPTEAEIKNRNHLAETATRKADDDYIRSLAPPGFETVAARCILEDKTREEARAALVSALGEQSPAVGSPEPQEKNRSDNNTPPVVKLEDFSDEEFTRAFGGN